MTAVFTDFFRTQLFNSLDKTVPYDYNANLMAGKSVHWVYFRSHAAFTSPQDARYTGVKTIADLAGKTGWSPPITPQSATQVVGCSTAADNTYVIVNNRFANGTNWPTSTVTAAALVLEGSYGGTTDPIIYLTDTPFEGGTVMRQADGLIARPVPALAGNRSLFAWPVWFTGQTTVQPIEGSVAVLQAPPEFEAAYTQHAWLVPQRINMVANPSFEANPGTNHWRSNGTVTHVGSTPTIPSAPGGGAWYGRFVGAAPLVAESNLFPLTHRGSEGDLWTIQAMVRGTGKVRVGFLGWEPDFLTTYADWGDKDDVEEVWDIPASGWLHIYALRRSAESTWGMVRIECDGGEMHLDNVLCEADWLRDWRYFDGDSTYGSRGDYSWYGGSNLKGQTYSCWYNHRRAVIGRLFAWDISENDFTVTDEEVQSQGFVYRWVPAGVRVEAHYDVLWPDDTQEAVPNNAGTAVTPYASGANGGVPNPWAAYQHLDAPTGRVSTPDAADLNISTDVVWVMKVRRTDPWPTYAFLMSKAGVGSTLSWSHAYGNQGQIHTAYSTTAGTGAGGFPSGPTHLLPAPLPNTAIPEDVDSYFAIRYQQNVGGATKGQALMSEDGVTWTPIGNLLTKTPAFTTIFDSANPINIGQSYDGTMPFPGRIYWAEQRTGIDPNGGTLVWRFDATEYPGAGTTFTDPRGRVWTLSSAAAIKRA